MAYEFNNANEFLTLADDPFDGLSALLCVLRFNVYNLTLGTSSETDILTMAISGGKGFDSNTRLSWAIVLSRKTTDNALAFTVVSTASAGSTAPISPIATLIDANAWYTVVAAWDGTSQKIWLSTGASATASAAADMRVSGGVFEKFKVGGGLTSVGTPSRIFDGAIGEVWIEKNGTFPTEAEVQGIFANIAEHGRFDFSIPLLNDSGLVDEIGGRVFTKQGSPGPINDHPPMIYPGEPIYTPAEVAAFKAAYARGSNVLIGAGSPY